MSGIIFRNNGRVVQAVLLFFVFLFVPSWYWFDSSINLLAYFQPSVPRGQLYYVLSKLFGLYGLVALCLQIVLGVIGSKVLFRWHQRIGILLVLFTFMHLFLFMVAASMRSGALKLGSVFPGFTTGFYHTAVSLGSIAFLLLLLVAAIGVSRHRFPLFFKSLHRLAFVAGLLAALHSFFIGTETRYIGMVCLYVFTVGFISVTVLQRFYMKAGSKLS